jgi:hypothetical protein
MRWRRVPNEYARELGLGWLLMPTLREPCRSPPRHPFDARSDTHAPQPREGGLLIPGRCRGPPLDTSFRNTAVLAAVRTGHHPQTRNRASLARSHSPLGLVGAHHRVGDEESSGRWAIARSLCHESGRGRRRRSRCSRADRETIGVAVNHAIRGELNAHLFAIRSGATRSLEVGTATRSPPFRARRRLSASAFTASSACTPSTLPASSCPVSKTDGIPDLSKRPGADLGHLSLAQNGGVSMAGGVIGFDGMRSRHAGHRDRFVVACGAWRAIAMATIH